MNEQRRMPTEKRIREYWNEWPDSLCFACEDDIDCERAHIIPRVEGGADDVSNLHMLCRTCHKVSEFLGEEEYWQWLVDWSIKDRTQLEALLRGIPCVSLGLSVESLQYLMTESTSESISSRTRRALAERKAAGVKLGAPRILDQSTREMIGEKRAGGMTLQAIADELNTSGVPTAKPGGRWWASTIRQVLDTL